MNNNANGKFILHKKPIDRRKVTNYALRAKRL